jgi:non-specific serine/threonine protein kinase/serine/threonine-protein kinase
MDATRWQQIKTILDKALDATPTARCRYLAEACGADADLRREIEDLLEFEKPETNLLEKSAFSILTEDAPRAAQKSLIGKQIGRYRIIDELGAGGMGAVYLAERADGAFEQRVALKLIRRAVVSDFVLRRFVNERQILASLEHPNIAHLIDGGTTDDDLPFFVMEYVRGENIVEFARSRNLPLADRLELFRKVCAAVSFAHQNLVIHRDLKPSNILVTKDGTPKLLDFGIAKLLKTESGHETATQHFVFTPEYASPEQIRGENLTTATDVYSLGVILYELLSGARPFRLGGKNLAEVIRTVTRAAPTPPSAVQNSKFKIQNSKQADQKSKPQNPKSLRGDLDNIVLKALKKEPERRYSSVEQFSEDVRRFLKGLPVAARRDTLRYRARKFVSRNPLGVAASLIAAAALIAGIFTAGYQARIANVERAKAERRFNDVRRLANSFIFEINEKIEASPIKARELLVERAVEYLDNLAKEAEGDAGLQAELATAYEKIGEVQNRGFSSGTGNTSGALENHRKALRIREKLFSGAPENLSHSLDLASSYMNIADLSVTVGDTTAALINYQQAVSTIETALRADPRDPDARRRLALAYARLGQGILRSGSISKSLEYYEKATAISKELAREFPSDAKSRRRVSVYKQYTAYALLEMGQEAEAFGHIAEAHEIERQIAESEPENLQNRRYLSTAKLWLGIALRRLGRREESLAQQIKALEIQQNLYEADKSNVADANALADCELELGWTFSENGDQKKAVEHFEKAIALYESVARVDTANLSVLRQIAFTRRHLGDAVFKTKNAAAAAKIYETALAESENVLQKDLPNSEFRHDKAVCLLRVAATDARNKTPAAEKIEQAICILEKLTAESPEHKQRQTDLENARRLLREKF